uniref:Fe2OG dioxygenase domain-containing protein n=1 Tax=Chlamydomonas euryale TaxID=1486919 RepID=A0A7R9VE33_9CHLO|mmetsp:Transcript_32725/g.97577  ORF Transcript_32725/g.97577 Transcript_32725/m.97577 type:complete len:637 (+) Transcript_32725:334-2244(+)
MSRASLAPRGTSADASGVGATLSDEADAADAPQGSSPGVSQGAGENRFREVEKRYQLHKDQVMKRRKGRVRGGKFVVRPTDTSDMIDVHDPASLQRHLSDGTLTEQALPWTLSLPVEVQPMGKDRILAGRIDADASDNMQRATTRALVNGNNGRVPGAEACGNHAVCGDANQQPLKAYLLAGRPGFILIPGALPHGMQLSLMRTALEQMCEPPANTNHTARYGPLPGLWQAAQHNLHLSCKASMDGSHGKPKLDTRVDAVGAHTAGSGVTASKAVATASEAVATTGEAMATANEAVATTSEAVATACETMTTANKAVASRVGVCACAAVDHLRTTLAVCGGEQLARASYVRAGPAQRDRGMINVAGSEHAHDSAMPAFESPELEAAHASRPDRPGIDDGRAAVECEQTQAHQATEPASAQVLEPAPTRQCRAGRVWVPGGPGPSARHLLRKLRWATLGPQFKWTARKYDLESEHRPLPAELGQIAAQVASAVASMWRPVDRNNSAPVGPFRPDAAIINYYRDGDTLGGHLDDVEPDMDQPIVTMSLGCDAAFLMGGRTKDVLPLPLRLRSGDVVVLAGEARRCYHGMPRIFSEQGLPDGLKPNSMRPDWEPFMQFMSQARINISVRAVTQPTVEEV